MFVSFIPIPEWFYQVFEKDRKNLPDYRPGINWYCKYKLEADKSFIDHIKYIPWKRLQQTEGRILFNSEISRIISVSPLYKLKHKQIYNNEENVTYWMQRAHEKRNSVVKILINRGKSSCVYIYF